LGLIPEIVSFSAHKVKGNEGGKSGKKDKQKEDTSPVSIFCQKKLKSQKNVPIK